MTFFLCVGIQNLDSLLSDLFLEFFGVLQVVIVDEFVHVFVRLFNYRGEGSDFIKSLLHFPNKPLCQ